MKIRVKLLLFNLSVIVGLAVLAITLIQDFSRLSNLPSQEENLAKRARSDARLLVRAAAPALSSADRQSIKGLIDDHSASTDLAFVGIWDLRHKVIASSGDGLSIARLTKGQPGKILRTGTLVATWLPVEIDGVRRGIVGLGYSLARIESARGRLVLFTVLIVLAVLISGALTLFFASRLTRPLKVMIGAFQQIADGELRQVRVPTDAKDEMGAMARAFNNMLTTLRHVGKRAVQVAKGDLSVTITAKGDLGNAIRAMILGQRKLVKQISETAVQLTAAMTEFQANAEQQERGAVEQSSAVEENRRTMDSLLESARQISETAQSVLNNAERSQNNSQLMAERIAALSAHTQRIAEILQVIKEIANKSDLLALNAALEGTKAGEAGRGFSLVASQMQRLAENVMSSVRDIKELTDTITEATRATVLATEESTKLSADTTQSARQISMIIRQQQTGTEQVTKAMDDVAQVARETAVGSKEIVASTADLIQLSERLQSLVGHYATDESPEESAASSSE